jgi:hypothetical protein
MILLDENIRDDQIILLRSWRIRVRFLVEDIAKPGIKDLDIIPLLHHLKQPVLFSHDHDFFKRELVLPGLVKYV